MIVGSIVEFFGTARTTVLLAKETGQGGGGGCGRGISLLGHRFEWAGSGARGTVARRQSSL